MECGCHARDASSNYTNKDGYGDDNDCGDDEGDNDYGDDNGGVRDRIGSLQSLLKESRALTARFLFIFI